MGRPVYAADEAEAVAALDRLGTVGARPAGGRGPGPPLPADAEVAGTAAIARDEPERVEVATESAGPSYLVLADTFDPGWSATVDGRPGADPAGVHGLPRRLRAGRPARGGLHVPAGGLRRRAGRQRMRGDRRAGPARLAPAVGPARPGARDDGMAARLAADGLAVALAVVVLASAVAWGPGGRPTVHRRWTNSFHRFTWGAGIEAIRQQPEGR